MKKVYVVNVTVETLYPDEKNWVECVPKKQTYRQAKRLYNKIVNQWQNGNCIRFDDMTNGLTIASRLIRTVSIEEKVVFGN